MESNQPPRPDRARTLDRDEIARRAYALWEARGRPEGNDVEIWLEAEAALVRSEMDAPDYEVEGPPRSGVSLPAEGGTVSNPPDPPAQETTVPADRMPARYRG